jgi:hypothetical protein
LCRLDSWQPTIIRNNCFSGSFKRHSWGIDLDDGSSNYQICNNLTIGCSIKLREGYYRLVENNIFIGPFPLARHCCYKENEDIIRRNICVDMSGSVAYEMFQARPADAKEIDYNLFWNPQGEPPVVNLRGAVAPGFKPAMSFTEWQAKGLDAHSIVADPQFVDPGHGDFRVKDPSPALKLGFKNFPMNQFGVVNPLLRPLAEAAHRKHDPVRAEVIQALQQRASAAARTDGASAKE